MAARQTWDRWIRACIKEGPSNPIRLNRNHMAMVTGTDARVLAAIAECWHVYPYDSDAAVLAVRALLPAMQQKCWPIARELIAFALDWHDRDRLWALVVAVQPVPGQAGA